MSAEQGHDEPYDYGVIDLFKVNAQRAAQATAGNITQYGYNVLPDSYGESVAVIDIGPMKIAFVLEGIGTKNVVADIVDEGQDFSHYDDIARCNIGTGINDLTTSGARPIAYEAFIATGEDDWFDDEKRAQAYILGQKAVCDELGIAWVGGESQVLSGVVAPGRAVLAGALIGDINPKSRHITGEKLKAGDNIVLIGSNGMHANGYSGARQLAENLPDKYATQLSDGTRLGEALLAPTTLYSNLVQALLDQGVDIHALQNITGHGWAKLMRSKKELAYTIDVVPPVEPLFDLIQEQTGYSDKTMYEKYTMGAGYAVFVSPEEAEIVKRVAEELGFKAWIAGTVEEGAKQVEIKPKKIILPGESFNIR